MKKIFTILFCLIFISCLQAQNIEAKSFDLSGYNLVANEEVYEIVEQMPDYPGGIKALLKYIEDSIIYPTAAKERGEKGRVVVRFVVKKDSTIGDVEILRGVSPELNKEAIRVIKSISGFIPGKRNGIPVNVWFTLPVSFKLF